MPRAQAASSRRFSALARAFASGLAPGLAVLVLGSLGAVISAGLAAGSAYADDRVDLTTTLYQEQRDGGQGGLRVLHQQAAVGTDIGDSASIDMGYSADVVSGATASVYEPDAVSSATTFSDLRHEGFLGLGFRGSRSSLSIGVGGGVERDYLSRTVTAGGSVDLPGKNTNLALSYTHNFDEVCDRDNAMLTVLERRALTGADGCLKDKGLFGKSNPGETVWRDIDIDTLQATLTQNLSPTANLQTSLFGQVATGFQSNPYRRVRIGGIDAQEAVPDVRARAALTVRANRYLPGIRGALHGMLRGYSDTWGVTSGTAEMAYSQYAGDSLLLRVRARIYQQTKATFFKDSFYYMTESTAGAYFTGDRELAPVRNVLVGAKLSFLKEAEDGAQILGVFDKLQLNIKTDVLLLDELPADDINANLEGIDDQFISTGLALVAQLGLLLAY